MECGLEGEAMSGAEMLSRELTYTSGSPTETPAKVRVNGIWFW